MKSKIQSLLIVALLAFAVSGCSKYRTRFGHWKSNSKSGLMVLLKVSPQNASFPVLGAFFSVASFSVPPCLTGYTTNEIDLQAYHSHSHWQPSLPRPMQKQVVDALETFCEKKSSASHFLISQRIIVHDGAGFSMQITTPKFVGMLSLASIQTSPTKMYVARSMAQLPRKAYGQNMPKPKKSNIVWCEKIVNAISHHNGWTVSDLSGSNPKSGIVHLKIHSKAETTFAIAKAINHLCAEKMHDAGFHGNVDNALEESESHSGYKGVDPFFIISGTSWNRTATLTAICSHFDKHTLVIALAAAQSPSL